MTGTLVYAIAHTDKPYLMSVLEWGPDRVKAAFTVTEDFNLEITNIEVHELGEVRIERLKFPVRVCPTDTFHVEFPSSPHHKMLHLLQVTPQ